MMFCTGLVLAAGVAALPLLAAPASAESGQACEHSKGRGGGVQKQCPPPPPSRYFVEGTLLGVSERSLAAVDTYITVSCDNGDEVIGWTGEVSPYSGIFLVTRDTSTGPETLRLLLSPDPNNPDEYIDRQTNYTVRVECLDNEPLHL